MIILDASEGAITSARVRCISCLREGEIKGCACDAPIERLPAAEVAKRALADPTLAGLSDVAIAEKLGISDQTVGRQRRKLPTSTFVDVGTKRIGRDGKARKPRKPKEPLDEAALEEKARKSRPLEIQAREIVRPLIRADAYPGSRALEALHGISHTHFDSAKIAERAIWEEEQRAAQALLRDQEAEDEALTAEPPKTTAQRKLAAFERKIEKRLRAEVEEARRQDREEVARLVANFEQEVDKQVAAILAERNAEETELAEQLRQWHSDGIGRQRPPLNNEEYRLILAVLHACVTVKDDEINAGADKRLEAFRIFKKHQLSLRSDVTDIERSGKAPRLPASLDELAARRVKKGR